METKDSSWEAWREKLLGLNGNPDRFGFDKKLRISWNFNIKKNNI
jgi:hypothetical protein